MKGEGKRPLLRPARERGRGENWKGGTERFPPCPRLSPLRASLGGRRLTARSAGTSLRGRGEAGSEGRAAAAGSGSERGFLCSAHRLLGWERRSPPASLSLAALPAFRPPPARPGLPLPGPAQAASPSHKAPLRAAHCSALAPRPAAALSSAGPCGAWARRPLRDRAVCDLAHETSPCPHGVKHTGKRAKNT